MCGIYGGHPDLLAPDPAAQLKHRGPDQQEALTLTDPTGRPWVLGQTRLNIVDRHDVPIPMQRDGVTLVYNGEVYNWRTLRDELAGLGHAFETQTDTEVVLAAFLQWGEACFDRFNGMFALALYDGESLRLVRDRLGKKPLFYRQDSAGTAFASEVKCFRGLDYESVPICEELEFHFDQHTPFRGVDAVCPGEVVRLTFDGGAPHRRRWWTFPEADPQIEDEREAVRLFLDLFQDACGLRLQADVPVTVFLSGGVDSSLIQAVTGVETTYTCQFEEFVETIDERSLVREFAERRGFEARMVTPGRDLFFETLGAQARAIEFPVGSFSVFPLFCLAQAARRDGFRVALSGEGADELFAGYFRHSVLLSEDRGLGAYFDGPYETLCRRYFGSGLERFCRMASRRGLGGVASLIDLLSPVWSEDRGMIDNVTRVEATLFLQPLLAMADRMSMANSLEVRNPFLDYRVVEFATKLAPNLRFHDGVGKRLLKAALRELVGDDLGIVNRGVKHGLPSPVNLWLFHANAFDRRDWNRLLLGECLKQLSLSQAGVPASYLGAH